MAKTSTARKEPEIVADAAPEPQIQKVCGTCQHWEARAVAFGICNVSGRFLPSVIATTDTTSCALWAGK